MHQSKTLYQKIFDLHVVRDLGNNQYQLFVGLHLIHEATSPQAFELLQEEQLSCAYPQLNFATADHVTPTQAETRPLADHLSEEMLTRLEQNVKQHGIQYFSPEARANGIVHVIGPEYGLTQPGMTIACGDSHTSTHGAFGAIAFGIGTSQVRDILASQTLLMERLKVRRIDLDGELGAMVTAKDVMLHMIQQMGPKAGVGYVYEFGGSCVKQMTMEERMTLCNMAVEAGARSAYVNPDQVTFDYLKETAYAPKGEDWEQSVQWWQSLTSDKEAEYDDRIAFDVAEIVPMTTWGINLGQAIPVQSKIPGELDFTHEEERQAYYDALSFMDLKPKQNADAIQLDVAFIGSCTNGRYSDFEQVAEHLSRTGKKVHAGVKALAVPGSYQIYDKMLANGITQVFIDAGFEVRLPGCSMCLAMNPDKLVGAEICASSSNRNFKGRQGSPRGRTLIMSPLSVAASAIAGRLADPQVVFA